ncbi:Hsp70 family protein [Desulfamplus magnetovallimortis]|uniref:Hsp70 family protein n=1 Tax=Desulfamplus magnetovallimortis TaxID=1246637 RepID=UPI0009BA8A44|nr:Hsp70 family protein [Desulfamplus magnetovallimortis]
MDFKDKRYVIGIDLGTTNSAVSYVDMNRLEGDHAARSIKIFNVPQLIGAGEFAPVPVLPSFLYIPGEYDISKSSFRHPWKRESDLFVGLFARDHGAQIPSRLVSSAKSWLCHARADREAPILPWGADHKEKISPVAATAEYLRHIRKAWNHSVKDEDLFLENQYTVITVPASFDESAREFTLEAAKIAGFGKDLTLLEEPLAAFYAWLIKHEYDWQNYVKPDDLILVCDVGGGTTDFTLIALKEAEGTPRFERLAVGDHLILGGDNIDLALARHVESKFSRREPLTPDKWKTLGHKCRAAKEKLLAGEQSSQDSATRITLKGEGRSLIAGTLSADLTTSDLKTILCQGFFPDVEPSRDAIKRNVKAMAEFGLPYEQEPAITRHIVWFLEKHRDNIQSTLGKEPMPDFILFNGGSLKPALLQDRIRCAIRKWFACKDGLLPISLENSEPDLSVALGASYYGLVKQGAGVRVGSGSPRSYYVGINTQEKSDTEVDNQQSSFSEILKGDVTPASKAVCIVERGLDEGSVISLPEMEFEVITNQPVEFSMFSSSFRSGDKSGDIVDIDDSLTPMAPLKTVIKFGKKGEKAQIPVRVEPQYTEMGTLAMWCRSSITPHRWKLQFQLRDSIKGEAMETEVYDDELLQEARNLISSVFSTVDDLARLSSIVKQIETLVGKKKSQWPLSFLRLIADYLISNAELRLNSPEHEIRWLNLTGFCVRPGFGDAFDKERIRQLWKIYLKGCQFPKGKQNAVEWWIFCRRIAGGLNAGQQRQFFQNISPYLLSDNHKRKLSTQEITEIWMAAANMERLLVKDKISLARKLLPQLKPGKTPRQFFWVLSRFGARELLYGSVDRVVPAKEVESWMKKIAKNRWASQDHPVYAMVLCVLRKTGDRTRDVSEELLEWAKLWIVGLGASKNELIVLEQPIPLESVEETAMFGESLPQGLIVRC